MDMTLVWCILLVYVTLASGTDDGTCDPNLCMNGGVCFNSLEISCMCKEPYIGDRCETNPCDPNPCQNGGECSPDPLNGFVCSCPKHYFDDTCKSFVDPCLTDPNPCMNDGKCEMTQEGYSCKCTESHTRKYCETNLCDPNPCENNGTCEVHGDNFTCNCEGPYTGLVCGSVADPCLDDTCKNGGTCQEENGQYKCLCIGKYSGKNCENDPCEPNPCKNNGTCQVENDEAVCICIDIFRGSRCELNPCVPNPCKNNGQCEVHSGEVVCTCDSPSHTGNLCDEVLDRCEQTTCQNGGSCQKENGQCNCTASFTGDYCEIEVTTVIDKRSSSPKPRHEATVTDPVMISPTGSPISESTTAINSSTEVATTEVSTRNTNQIFQTSINEISISYQSSSHEPVIVSSTVPGSSDGTTEDINPDMKLSTTEVSTRNTNQNFHTSTNEISTSYQSSSHEPVIVSSTVPGSSDDTTEDINPDMKLSTPEVSTRNTNQNFHTSTNEISTSYQSSSHEPVIVSSTVPGSSDDTTEDINPDMKLSTTEVSTRNTNQNFHTSTNEISTSYLSSSHEPVIVISTVPGSSDGKTEDINPDMKLSTTEVSYSDEESGYETSSISGSITTETSSDDDVIKNEISTGQASPKTVAYVCGAIGVGLGLLLLVAAIVHFSKRLKTKKRTLSFQNADNTSISSANSASNLV